MRKLCAVLAAAGLGVLLPAPAWAASGPQQASGTIFLTAPPVIISTQAADGNTIVVYTLDGMMTGTFAGPFTETDREVLHPDGSVTIEGKGMQSGKLGTCGTGTVPFVTEAQGTTASVSGRFQTIDQAASTSAPMTTQSVDTLVFNSVTGLGTYTGTYHCT